MRNLRKWKRQRVIKEFFIETEMCVREGKVMKSDNGTFAFRRLSNDDFLFHQRRHRSFHTVASLCCYVPEVTESENVPPNSPDINFVDYSVCGVLQSCQLSECVFSPPCTVSLTGEFIGEDIFL